MIIYNNRDIKQLDYTKAFAKADFKEEFYMDPPPGPAPSSHGTL